MAPRNNVRLLGLSLTLALVFFAGFPSQAVSAAPSPEGVAIPDLATFAISVLDGNPDVLKGVYVEDVMAFPVVQQPYAAFVSEQPGTVTQFGMASSYGVTGLLAHNFLGGTAFFYLEQGQVVNLIYGDGGIDTYVVTDVLRFQATSPNSVYSGFVDLRTGKGTDAEGMFRKVYMGEDQVTFQTCIAKDGLGSWGRLFIIASSDPEKITQARLEARQLAVLK
jgi:hypothetical protein